MFKLNLKIALRNLWKNRVYTGINIFGLAVGLAGFMIILLYINKENGYDKWDPILKRSYLVSAEFTKNGAVNKGTKIEARFAQVVKEQFPTVENVSMGWLNGDANVRYEKGTKLIKEKLSSVSMDHQFFKSYPLQAIYGRMEDVFTQKNAVAISASKARQLFGDEEPLNQILIENLGLNAAEKKLIVKAVWDDQEQPSYFGFDLFFAADFSSFGSQLMDRNFSIMLTLGEGVVPETLFEQIEKAYLVALARVAAKNADINFNPSEEEARRVLKDKEGITSFKLVTEPVSNLNLGTFYSTTAKQTTIYILVLLASFMIIISCINYTNLALVLAQSRAKEVGVKKVLGANKLNLILQFFTETVIQCVLSYAIALIFVELLLPSINHIMELDLSLLKSVDLGLILGQALLILVIVVLIAGAYPAIALAGFLPVKVLKGNFSTARHIGGLRKVLVVGQFTIAPLRELFSVPQCAWLY